MGILNVTPDSFYASSRVQEWTLINTRVTEMLSEGMNVLDIGGYSSRPGATDISEQEELDRVVPVIEKLSTHFPDLLISVDTFRSRVADEAISVGASFINDISGGNLDEKIYKVATKYQVPYILMHMRGTPQTMNTLTQYDNLLREMVHYFGEKITHAKKAGVRDIILDPGFGFSKSADQSFEILANLNRFSVFGCPILVGLSRKSMIYKTLGISAEESLNGTTALNTVALLKGADFLRVHDVKVAAQTIDLLTKTGLID